MRQLSLFSDERALARVMPAIRASMHQIAGEDASQGRDILLDKINAVARLSGVKLLPAMQRK